MRIAIILCSVLICSQTIIFGAEYESLMQKDDYKGALAVIRAQIENIYSKRVEGKRLPTDFITLGSEKEKVNLNRIFRERKADQFFIEDNPELYKLHNDAAKCCYETRIYDDAINNYYQSLRFRAVKYDGEDRVFYGIAQVYKKKGSDAGYIDALETAYALNERNYAYSLELGKALYRSKHRKKSIYHLERYLQSKGDSLDDNTVLTMLAGLSEAESRYLNAEKYYKMYLERKGEDGVIHFALGHLAFNNTGNYILAESELKKAISLLSEKEIFRKSKAYEYIGDMKFNTLKWVEAISAYSETVRYQDLVLEDMKKNDAEIEKMSREIRALKSGLMSEKNFAKYNEYQFQMQERELKLADKREKKYEYNKLNPGKARWNIAESYDKTEKLDDAIKYYRQAITFNYRPNEAREKIIKIQLKIKRGY